MNKETLSTEETLKEIDEMMEFLRKLSVIYQRDPDDFPEELLQGIKELIAKGIEFCGGSEDRKILPDFDDPRMTNQEIYDTLKRIIKDTERLLRHYEARMELED